jgi:hypothetical protein
MARYDKGENSEKGDNGRVHYHDHGNDHGNDLGNDHGSEQLPLIS